MSSGKRGQAIAERETTQRLAVLIGCGRGAANRGKRGHGILLELELK
jgi:hypothetical protein